MLKAVRPESPPRYERAPAESSFVSFEPRVRALLAQTPDMPATALAERVGWSGSITWFREKVKRLRSQFRPIDPADRLTWDPGDAAQCDTRDVRHGVGSRALDGRPAAPSPTALIASPASLHCLIEMQSTRSRGALPS